MRPKIIRSILLALHACDGVPMPESALISAVQIHLRPQAPTDSDVTDALKAAESARYVSGLSDDLTGRSWTLTEAGKHKARQIQ